VDLICESVRVVMHELIEVEATKKIAATPCKRTSSDLMDQACLTERLSAFTLGTWKTTLSGLPDARSADWLPGQLLLPCRWCF
jgi:hypothetical protein